MLILPHPYPHPSSSSSFLILSVDNVVLNGTRHLHTQWDGITYHGHDGSFAIIGDDTPLVALGRRKIFHTPLKLYGEPKKGVHFNLFNNMWNTKCASSSSFSSPPSPSSPPPPPPLLPSPPLPSVPSYPLWYPYDDLPGDDEAGFHFEFILP